MSFFDFTSEFIQYAKCYLLSLGLFSHEWCHTFYGKRFLLLEIGISKMLLPFLKVQANEPTQTQTAEWKNTKINSCSSERTLVPHHLLTDLGHLRKLLILAAWGYGFMENGSCWQGVPQSAVNTFSSRSAKKMPWLQAYQWTLSAKHTILVQAR